MANPRVEELRKKLEREPGSRLFAQLAEELRREGALVEALRLCREGLVRHPTYSSARLTFARCLLDSGDQRGAVTELQTVCDGAPDNVAAGRLLADTLAQLGEHRAAVAAYEGVLKAAPGDAQVKAALAKSRDKAAAAQAAPAAASAADMENRFADEFVVERPGFAEEPGMGAGALPPGEVVFDFDVAPTEASFQPVFRPLDEPAEQAGARLEAFAIERGASAAKGDDGSERPVPVTVPGLTHQQLLQNEIASPTLAELYLSQGDRQRAIETYEAFVKREPGHGEARRRLRGLQSVSGPGAATEPADVARRRAVLLRTIARLEQLLIVVGKA